MIRTRMTRAVISFVVTSVLGPPLGALVIAVIGGGLMAFGADSHVPVWLAVVELPFHVAWMWLTISFFSYLFGLAPAMIAGAVFAGIGLLWDGLPLWSVAVAGVVSLMIGVLVSDFSRLMMEMDGRQAAWQSQAMFAACHIVAAFLTWCVLRLILQRKAA